MFDIKSIEAEAQAEIIAERSSAAKEKIKAKLAQIDKAQKVVQTLRLEYAALLEDIGLEV